MKKIQFSKSNKQLMIGAVTGGFIGLVLVGLLDATVFHHRRAVIPQQTLPPQSSQPQVPVKTLPTNIEGKLSSFSARLHTVTALPTKVKAQNVLYISPTEDYAVTQFARVWPDIKDKPTVIWTGATQAQAEGVWANTGYKFDPLPSPQTEYVTNSLPTPDAYHQVSKNTWIEMPGVLRTAEVNKWPGFFDGRDDKLALVVTNSVGGKNVANPATNKKIQHGKKQS